MRSRRRPNSPTIRFTARSDSGAPKASIAAIWVKAAAQEELLIINVSIFAASSRGATP